MISRFREFSGVCCDIGCQASFPAASATAEPSSVVAARTDHKVTRPGTPANGNPRALRLLSEVRQLIHRQPEVVIEGSSGKRAPEPRVLPCNSKPMGSNFTRAARLRGQQDPHFHDLRHEATSHLFERGLPGHPVLTLPGQSLNLVPTLEESAMNSSRHVTVPARLLPGGQHTAAEIAQQPALWRELVDLLDGAQARLDGFLGEWLHDPRKRVIFTGAGSSGFIADMVADHANMQWPADMRALHTTSLLTHPASYLEPDRPTLLVSFGRSGSSPESVAAVDLVRSTVKATRFLDITCNADGELARRGKDRTDTCTLLMPAASCDRAFAMTSSLTCMLLAALAAFDCRPWPQRLAQLGDVAALGESALHEWQAAIADLAAKPFARVIYLGSGPLEAWAREAALKLQELTAGRVPAFANTPLGFRHGPKSLLDADTLVVMARSTQALSRRYEQDLLAELRRDAVAGHVLSLGPTVAGEADDFSLQVAPALTDCWLAPVWLLVPQLLALHRSAALGLAPDNPFPDGTVNRVVQGVTIHTHD